MENPESADDPFAGAFKAIGGELPYTSDVSSEPLTLEALKATMRKFLDEPMPPPCGSRERPHVVHPRAKGWTTCSYCFAPVLRPS